MSRAMTADELRKEVLDHCRVMALYWAYTAPVQSVEERVDGMAFSIFTMLDGGAGSLPAFDLVARPHPDDKAFYEAEDEDWIEDGTVINDDAILHEEWVR